MGGVHDGRRVLFAAVPGVGPRPPETFSEREPSGSEDAAGGRGGEGPGDSDDLAFENVVVYLEADFGGQAEEVCGLRLCRRLKVCCCCCCCHCCVLINSPQGLEEWEVGHCGEGGVFFCYWFISVCVCHGQRRYVCELVRVLCVDCAYMVVGRLYSYREKW